MGQAMKTPEQAQEAHDLARERIAEAKAGGERGLSLSPQGFDLDGKIYPGDERFDHLTALPPEIAGLATLQWLKLSGTQVTDIAPLAGLTALRTLDLVALQADPALNAQQSAGDDPHPLRDAAHRGT